MKKNGKREDDFISSVELEKKLKMLSQIRSPLGGCCYELQDLSSRKEKKVLTDYAEKYFKEMGL